MSQIEGAPIVQKLLAASMLALVTCPLFYIGMGAPLQFPTLLSIILIPPTLLAIGFLLWQFVGSAAATLITPIKKIGEYFSAAIILLFVYLVSNFNLQTPLERLGLTSVFFLIGFLGWLPVVIWRKPRILARLSLFSLAMGASMLGVLFLATLVLIGLWLTTPTQFIG